MGTIVEMYFLREKKACWALAAVPDYDLEDVRAMATEAELKRNADKGMRIAQTPHELMDSIKQHKPICGTLLVDATPADFLDPHHPDLDTRLKCCARLTHHSRDLLTNQPSFDWGLLLGPGARL